MQIQCMPIFKVIFVLSTIVAVTDCCSSRILLLRQHTLQIEEHVVQLVNQLELQQQLNADGQPSERDIFADAAQMQQVLPDLDLERKLATIGTTEGDSSTVPWSTDEETTTTTPSTASTSTTTTTAMTLTSTNTMPTGEPPPDDSTPRLATEVAILDLNVAVPTTTTTTTTTMTSTGASNTKIFDDLRFKKPCSDDYRKYFCLNGGNCFRLEDAKSFIYCICPSGYVGERCDSKTEDGVYVPLRPATSEPQLKTAHIVFSFPMLVLLSTIYVVFGAIFMLRNVSAQRRKQQQLHLDKQRFFVSC